MKLPFSLPLSAMLLAAGLSASEHHEVHWDYDAHGPAHWCDFSAVCKDGKAQSPIDIRTAETVSIAPNHIIKLQENVEAKSRIVDNGHAIQVDVENGGKISVEGIDYRLIQFHFHGRSEEKIDGKQYDLVAHMVHKSDSGNLLVVGVLFEEGDKANAILETVIQGVGTNGVINPGKLLPEHSDHYYHFMGSLTTPPCTENVRWYVMKEAQSATKEQIEAMRRFYDHNYRPIQPLNGRIVESI
ncbi:MAG: carbonic anhydrase family protein [Campylobacterales bacterium]|nr:carbonic anhydrase family protein [Campylobacterales bacterium]